MGKPILGPKMKTITPAVPLSDLFSNASTTNVTAKTADQLMLVPVTTSGGQGLYEQMGLGSNGHTVSWKLLGISKNSTGTSFSTPSEWNTGDAVPTGDVYPVRIQIYVP